MSQEIEQLGLFETTVPINKPVINLFAKGPTIYFAKDDNGAIYVSNGYFVLKINQKIFDDLIVQVNNRKKTSEVAIAEKPRLMDIIKNAKGNFELSQKPHELEMGKGNTAYVYAGKDQYFGYNKKYVDFFIKSVTRLFVDDHTGYDYSSHSMIAKNRRNEVLGVVLPINIPDVLYTKLADILPLESERKSDIERIKENPTNDPYIGKQYFDGRDNRIIAAIKTYDGVDMYVVPVIENGKLQRRADLIKADEIKKHIDLWDKNGIAYIEVLKRTFEGNTDPAKNGDALTSKYYPSKKYLLRCKYSGSDHESNETYETKSLAEFAKEQKLKYSIDSRKNIVEKKPGVKTQMAKAAKQAAEHNAARPPQDKGRKNKNAEL